MLAEQEPYDVVKSQSGQCESGWTAYNTTHFVFGEENCIADFSGCPMQQSTSSPALFSFTTTGG